MVAISVIIPVFNVKKYLKECLDSVACQTLSQIEVICVDDNSTDGSREILQEYAKQDTRFKVLHATGHGAAAARNLGIEKAQGEYIYFIDADDKITPDYLMELYKTAMWTGCKIVACENILLFFGEENPLNFYQKAKYCGVLPITPKTLCATPGRVMCWNKLFNAQLLKQQELKFADTRYAEDIYFYYTVILNVQKIAFANKGGYIYRRHNNSLMAQMQKELKTDDHIKVFIKLFEYYQQHNLLKKFFPPLVLLKTHLQAAHDRQDEFYKIKNLLLELNARHFAHKAKDIMWILMLEKCSYKMFVLLWQGFRDFKKKITNILKSHKNA